VLLRELCMHRSTMDISRLGDGCEQSTHNRKVNVNSPQSHPYILCILLRVVHIPTFPTDAVRPPRLAGRVSETATAPLSSTMHSTYYPHLILHRGFKAGAPSNWPTSSKSDVVVRSRLSGTKDNLGDEDTLYYKNGRLMGRSVGVWGAVCEPSCCGGYHSYVSKRLFKVPVTVNHACL
jgi:hypothetical protein